MEEETFDPELIYSIFKLVWGRRATERNESVEVVDLEAGDRTKKNRQTTEAVQRSGLIAEAEGINNIEPTHLERVLPQLLLDF
ncbi:protein MHF2 homolog isoform X3 [Elaeis guineensis]|uniref:protein MHF2 homolog isoform X3 n=1 Tax=Elaeis guineensis var. tenera TaxID=51953 RepID=UPI003C6D6178